jgi:hypothetical protein
MSLLIEPLSASAPVKTDRLAVGLLATLIVGMPLIQKLAVPAGSTQLYFGFFLLITLTFMGFITRRLQFKKKRAAIYLLMAAGIIMSQLLTFRDFSPLSLMNLIIITLPYTLSIIEGSLQENIELKLFRTLIDPMQK